MSETTTPTAPATSRTVERYVQFWNTTPDEQRRTGPALFSDDIVQVAPVGVLAGLEALATFTEQFAAAGGPYRFRIRTAPEIHHGRARVPWQIDRDGEVFAEGTDVLVIGHDGRITSITTFLDRAPAGFDPQH